MAKKKTSRINWRYAIGEILLIFIGITAAISFNNWNESRKTKRIEVGTLQEVREAIRQDLTDINGNIEGFGNRVALYRMLIDHFENAKPLSDSLSDLIPYIEGLTTYYANTGPYETLKSRGIETITNDSVRLKISVYYDLDYERIKTDEQDHHDLVKNYIRPQIIENFNLSNKLSFIDYERTINDTQFQQVVYWALRTDYYMQRQFEYLGEKAQTLLLDLDAEIERLE